MNHIYYDVTVRAEQSRAEQLSCLSTDGQLHHHRHRWCVCVSAVHVIISGTAVPFGCSSGGPRWGPWDGPSLDLARSKVISIFRTKKKTLDLRIVLYLFNGSEKVENINAGGGGRQLLLRRLSTLSRQTFLSKRSTRRDQRSNGEHVWVFPPKQKIEK